MLVTACAPSQEAERVALAVVVDGSGVGPSSTDLGWTVRLTQARMAVANVQFTVQGEMHGATAGLGGWLMRKAWAHPGHYAGGEVTGELPGEFIVDWLGEDKMTLGTASLLVGDYNGMNFSFRAATVADGLAADDPLLGHTAQLRGTASKDGVTVMFAAVVDVDAGAQLVGAPFEDEVDAEAVAPIELQLLPSDPKTGASLFDGLDFAALEAKDGVATIRPGEVAHNLLRRTLQSHVHYNASPK